MRLNPPWGTSVCTPCVPTVGTYWESVKSVSLRFGSLRRSGTPLVSGAFPTGRPEVTSGVVCPNSKIAQLNKRQKRFNKYHRYVIKILVFSYNNIEFNLPRFCFHGSGVSDGERSTSLPASYSFSLPFDFPGGPRPWAGFPLRRSRWSFAEARPESARGWVGSCGVGGRRRRARRGREW